MSAIDFTTICVLTQPESQEQEFLQQSQVDLRWLNTHWAGPDHQTMVSMYGYAEKGSLALFNALKQQWIEEHQASLDDDVIQMMINIALMRCNYFETTDQHLDIVNGLMTSDIDLNIRKRAICAAAEKGSMAYVRNWLTDPAVSPDFIGEFVKSAAKGGSIEIVQFLLSKSDISKQARKEAIQMAEKYFHPQIAAFLCEPSCCIIL